MKNKIIFFSSLSLIFVLTMAFMIRQSVQTPVADDVKMAALQPRNFEAVPDTFWIHYFISHTVNETDFHDELVEFYKNRNYRPAWMNNGRLSPAAKELLAAIRNSVWEGLYPSDYFYNDLQLAVLRAGKSNHGNLPCIPAILIGSTLC